jgi:hypothetical protein
MILHSIWIERPKTLQKMEARAYWHEAFGRSFYWRHMSAAQRVSVLRDSLSWSGQP